MPLPFEDVEPETSEQSPENSWIDYGVQVEVAESTEQDPVPGF